LRKAKARYKKPLTPKEQAEAERPQREKESPSTGDLLKMDISPVLSEAEATLHTLTKDADDILYRNFKFGRGEEVAACLIYVDGLVDKAMLQRDILHPLMLTAQKMDTRPDATTLRDMLQQHFIAMIELKDAFTYQEVMDAVLGADACLLIDGLNQAFVLGVKSWEHRNISEPLNETVIRGPQEAFNEVMKINTALLRRWVKDPNLTMKYSQIGTSSKTDIAVVYVSRIVNPVIVTEVERRLKTIDFDGILDSGYVEQFIEDDPWSPFPQVQNTERPDKVAAAILEGRVAIFVDGSPFVLLVPAVLANFLPTPEDYYERFIMMTIVRLIRSLSLYVAVLLPGLYIAVLTYHQEMMPARLAWTIAAAREGVPFPALLDAVIMEVTFELLREASLRLPNAIGQTVGIVGGLVIGQAAVAAGLVSPLMVVVVALTAIGSFAVPSFDVSLTLRFLRFPFMILAAFYGLYGIMAGIILLYLHMVHLQSFGVPYMAPLSPASMGVVRDTIVRAPLWSMRLRPLMFKPKNRPRAGESTSAYQEKMGGTRAGGSGKGGNKND
jgi:hypothetical protein